VTPALLSTFPSLGVVILGDGKNLHTLKERATALGISDQVMFAGSVPYETVPDWINALDVGVSFLKPAHSGASEQKVRQYLACGIPVVVSPGSSQFVETAGIGSVVAYDDLGGIADAISKWLDMDANVQKETELRACQYVLDRLSLQYSCQKRIDIWVNYLSELNKTRGTG